MGSACWRDRDNRHRACSNWQLCVFGNRNRSGDGTAEDTKPTAEHICIAGIIYLTFSYMSAVALWLVGAIIL